MHMTPILPAERTALEAIQKACALALQPGRHVHGGPPPKPGEVAETPRRTACDDCQGELREAQSVRDDWKRHALDMEAGRNELRDEVARIKTVLAREEAEHAETCGLYNAAQGELARLKAELHAAEFQHESNWCPCKIQRNEARAALVTARQEAAADMRERCARAALTAESPTRAYATHDGRVPTLAPDLDAETQRRLCADAIRALTAPEEAPNA